MRKWIIVLLALVSGCASYWQQTSGTFSGAGYALDPPRGWMETKDPKHLRITRDGPLLQQIHVFVGNVAEQNKNANKTVKQGMLPQELAESILDAMRNNKNLVQFTVVENAPAQLAARDGFRLGYTFKEDKVRYRCEYYGMLDNDTFYRITYCAPVRYYFDKDVAVFEEVVRSFRLVGETRQN